MSNRVLIIADSLAMPRSEVKYQDTWVFKLKKHLPDSDIIDKSRRASTVTRLVTEGTDGIGYPPGSDLLEFYAPNSVILQLGVTDCAPRLFPNKSLLSHIISKAPKSLANILLTLFKKYRGRKASFSYISLEQFDKNIRSYLERALQMGTKSVLAIEIGLISQEVAKKSPEFREQIHKYNQCLYNISLEFSFFEVVSTGLNDSNVEELTVDGYHVNAEGHRVIFDNLRSKISF